jgi:arylsulfatase A-like enzyme
MTSVALIVLDTLRKDAFDRHFQWLPGTNFKNAYAPSHYTVPSHASLFTGLYPSETGTNANSHQFTPPNPPLARRLQAEGLETHAFSANVQISRQFGWDRGFDRYSGSWNSKHANATDDIFEWNAFIREHRDEGPQRYFKALWSCLSGDCDTITSLKHGLEIKYRTHTVSDSGAQEALSHVRGTDFADNAFLFMNLMEAHGPYRPPEEYRTVEFDEMPGFAESVQEESIDEAYAETIRQAYDDSVRYLSEKYKAIFAELKDEFDYVITLADHGENLGENGIWGHGLGLYPELTHVPLSIWGIDGEETREDTVSLIDVHRTILEMVGVKDNEYEGRGRDLRSQVDHEPQLTEYLGLNMWREQKLEAAGKADEFSTYDRELYGIATAENYYGYEDFDESFVESGTASLEAPRDRMDELVDDLDYLEGADDIDVSDSVMESLEDLGYA